MTKTEEFFKLFEVGKIEYRTPGRTVDDEGEICEWYVEREYPPIEPVFFDLLNLFVQYNYDKTIYCPLREYSLCLNLVQGLMELHSELNEELKEELKRDIQDIFTDYYEGEIIED